MGRIVITLLGFGVSRGFFPALLSLLFFLFSNNGKALVDPGASYNSSKANLPPYWMRSIPHFARSAGLQKCPGPSDPLELRQELLTILSQTQSMWPPATVDTEGNVVGGWISIPNVVGQGVWEEMIVLGKGVRVYLRDYRKAKTGEVYFYDARGIHRLDPQEYEALLDTLRSYLESGATWLWERLGSLPEKVNARYPKELLEEEVRVREGLTIPMWEILGLPRYYEPSDFLPDELYFGPIAPWGMVYLGLYGEYNRRVFLHPEAFIYDCLSGQPLVLAHELVHAQPRLQYLPLAWYTDVEILTELSSGLWDTTFWEMLHPYLYLIMDLVEAAFGYTYRGTGGSMDFRSERAGLSWPNLERVRKHQQVWEKISDELRSWVLEDLMPDFYQDPLYSLSLNMRYCWDSAFVAVSFLTRFELAGLDGYENTQSWLAQNEKVIEEIWERALADTGTVKELVDPQETPGLYPERDFCPQPFSFAFVSPQMKRSVDKLKKAILKDYREHGREFVVQKLLRGGYRVR